MKSLTASLDHNLPQHVAIVMDGNGRWANSRSLKRSVGHQVGISSVKNVIKSCMRYQIPYLSLFAFGQDNWKRAPSETSFLLQLFRKSLLLESDKLHAQGVKIIFIGDLEKFPSDLIETMNAVQTLTASNSKMTMIVAVNYSGRWDICTAFNNYYQKHGHLPKSEDHLSPYLTTANSPDPDLFIRTSGEQRLSNFMLWQSAYTELYFTQVYWPDFDQYCFERALMWYAKRQRRFGGAQEVTG